MTANRPAWLRWLVPAVAVLATTAGATALKTAAAAEPRLPARTAAQLLVDLQTARIDGLSGMVTQRAELGLPSLPGVTGQDSALSSLISGTHTLRIWYSGPDSARVALLGTLGESDIITNGNDVWIWSSRENTATHSVRPAGQDQRDKPLDPANLPKTPQEAADAALAAIDPTTAVSTAGPVKVAGRSSYELVLAPRDHASLISQIRIAIDGDKHVPLRVRVYAQGVAEPSIEVAFTQVSFARPGPEQFRFNPPPGAKIVEEKADAPAATNARPEPKAATIGEGWTTVLVARAPMPKSSDQIGGLLQRLPAVSGSWGSGHLLSGNLFSVLVTSDGRTLAGAVRPERLYQAAADPAAALK
jgi:outer membrane lipoprotein-sorting protein